MSCIRCCSDLCVPALRLSLCAPPPPLPGMTQHYTQGDILCHECGSDKLEYDMQARKGWCFNILVFFFRVRFFLSRDSSLGSEEGFLRGFPGFRGVGFSGLFKGRR